jgi:hypothetical protein
MFPTSWDCPDFMGFKELCPSVPQNLLQVAKCLDFYQVIKYNMPVSTNILTAVGRKHVAVGHPVTSH